MNDKTFVVGIGAQKCGTTWLHDYFLGRGDVYLSSLKELHYFDQVFRPDLFGQYGRMFERTLVSILTNNTKRKQPLGKISTIDVLDRVRMNYDPCGYVSYFQSRVPAHTTHFSEITPSYSLLPPEGFAAIKEMFPSSKFVFLMRDPIERYYSSLRMHEKRHKDFSAYDSFEQMLHSRETVERGHYHKTLENLYKSIPSQDVFVGFYEELFTENEISRLCRFLGLPYMPARFRKVVHKSPEGRPLTPEMKNAARVAFDDVYKYCIEKFAGKLPQRWNVAL